MSIEISRPVERHSESRARRRAQLQTTLGYAAAFVFLGMVSASLGPTLSGLADNTGTLLRDISFLFTARSLGYLAGSFFGGRLYDKVPGHPLMAFMLVVMALAMALAPLTSVLWLLTVTLLIVGIGEGAVDVGGNTLLVWVHHERVGPFMNAVHFCFGLGAFLSPIIIAQAILVSGDVRWAYWVLSLLMLPPLLLLMRLPSPAGRADTEAKSQALEAHQQVGQSYDELLLIALFVFFFVLYVGVEVSFGGWIFSYAVETGLSAEASAAYLTSAFWGALTVGRLMAIPIAARLRPRWILLSDLVGCIASVGMMLLWSNSLAVIWLGALGLGFSMASIFPITLTLAERRIPITGRVTGWFLVGASVGGMSVPWLIGQLFESFGPRIMLLVILIDLIVALGVYVAVTGYSARYVARTKA